MMKVGAINNGVVIDHIAAGKGMDLYHFLNLDHLDAPIALIKNAPSEKMGKKDIIKIDAEQNLDLVQKYGIRQGPTLVIDDGVHTKKYVNASNIQRYVDELED